MKIKNNQIKNISWSFVGRFIGIISLVLTNSLAARYLTIKDFAFFSLIMSLIPSAFIFLSFGQDVTSSKFLPKLKSKVTHYENLVKVFVMIICVFLLFSFFFIDEIITFFRGDELLVTYLFTIIIISSILRIVSDYFRATNNFKNFVLFNSIRSSGGIIIWSFFLLQIFFYFFNNQLSIINIFASLAFSCLLTLLIFFFIRGKRIILFLKDGISQIFNLNSQFKIYLKSCSIIALSSILVVLKSDYDFWIVSAFAKENELAYYAPLIKIAALIMVPLSIFESLMPKNISFYFNKNKRSVLEKYIRTMNTYMFYPSLIFVLIIFFFSKDILLILFGAKFIHLDLLLKCVAISFLPKIFFGPCGQILLFTNFEKINLTVNLTFFLLSIIIGIVLTTNYGYYGMVVTYIIGLIGINLTFYIIVMNKVKINPLPYFNIFKAIKNDKY